MASQALTHEPEQTKSRKGLLWMIFFDSGNSQHERENKDKAQSEGPE